VSTGQIINRYEYDAYGQPTIRNRQCTETYSYSGNSFLFTGRETDILDNGSLKIQYNRNRSYDYATGRWLQRDPAGYVDSFNLYEYVRSSPIQNRDPSGKQDEYGPVPGKLLCQGLCFIGGLACSEGCNRLTCYMGRVGCKVVCALLVSGCMKICDTIKRGHSGGPYVPPYDPAEPPGTPPHKPYDPVPVNPPPEKWK
jgi:RHS repeat-associated protein